MQYLDTKSLSELKGLLLDYETQMNKLMEKPYLNKEYLDNDMREYEEYINHVHEYHTIINKIYKEIVLKLSREELNEEKNSFSVEQKLYYDTYKNSYKNIKVKQGDEDEIDDMLRLLDINKELYINNLDSKLGLLRYAKNINYPELYDHSQDYKYKHLKYKTKYLELHKSY